MELSSVRSILKNYSGTSNLGLANTTCQGDMQELTNQVNDALVAVTSDLPRLADTHPAFHVQGELPAEYTISVSDTEAALRKIKTNKATGPDRIPAWILKGFSYILAPPLASIFNSSLRKRYSTNYVEICRCSPAPEETPANINRKGAAAYLPNAHCCQCLRNYCSE